MWHGSNEKGDQAFNNQALNTLVSYSGRAFTKIAPTFDLLDGAPLVWLPTSGSVKISDARDLRDQCDLWVTDPPYADAVNYHELGDFFLAWYDKQIGRAFPEWTPDARAELAVRGDGEEFRWRFARVQRV